jgi:hypothetical protein
LIVTAAPALHRFAFFQRTEKRLYKNDMVILENRPVSEPKRPRLSARYGPLTTSASWSRRVLRECGAQGDNPIFGDGIHPVAAPRPNDGVTREAAEGGQNRMIAAEIETGQPLALSPRPRQLHRRVQVAADDIGTGSPPGLVHECEWRDNQARMNLFDTQLLA